MSTTAAGSRAQRLAGDLIAFLETGKPAEGREEAVALRLHQHPTSGRVVRSRLDETPTGFVLEFDERWHDGGHDWYAREIARADVGDDGITELSVYCTGDWDQAREEEHRRAVRLLRP